MKKIYENIIKWLTSNIDKVLHYTLSMLIVLWLSVILHILIASAIALAIGFVKEWIDSKREDNRWSWWDILADILGVLSVVVPLML